MHNQLTPRELELLNTLSSFDHGVEIALDVLMRIGRRRREIVQLCGPMSTGGRGDLTKNMAFFGGAMRVAHRQGVTFFNQMPFQGMMIRLTGYKPGMPKQEYNLAILEGFYGPVLGSGFVDRVMFLPDWQSSHGASWEREMATRIGLPISEYPQDWLAEIELEAAA